MEATVPILAALIAGILSFFSPCIFPIVPGFLGYLGGTAAGQSDSNRKFLLLNTALFILGVTTIFVGFGFLAGLAGLLVLTQFPWVTTIAGIIVILFGFQIVVTAFDTGWARKLSFYSYLSSPKVEGVKEKFSSEHRSFLMGAAFGVGWTPCIGPILGSILMLAYSSETAFRGALLLFVYSMGLGIPFLLSVVFIERFLALKNRLRRFLKVFQVAGGIMLVVLGWLIATDRLVMLYNWLDFLPVFDIT